MHPPVNQNTPPGDSAQITQGLGGYTHRVRSRAPSGEPEQCPSDSARITWELGIYTHRVRSRAPSGESKHPPGDSARITRGLRGYTHRVRSRAPSGKSNHPPGDSIRFTRGLLSGTEYWGTQRGGANNHQTLMLLNKQERDYNSCLTSGGKLHLARRLRAGFALLDV